jgi:hypothetical protein
MKKKEFELVNQQQLSSQKKKMIITRTKKPYSYIQPEKTLQMGTRSTQHCTQQQAQPPPQLDQKGFYSFQQE